MATEYAKALGNRLRAIRQQQGLSLQRVEEKSGGKWKAVVVGSYERGDRAVTVAKLAQLADFYGVPVSVLLPGVAAYIGFSKDTTPAAPGLSAFRRETTTATITPKTISTITTTTMTTMVVAAPLLLPLSSAAEREDSFASFGAHNRSVDEVGLTNSVSTSCSHSAHEEHDLALTVSL